MAIKIGQIMILTQLLKEDPKGTVEWAAGLGLDGLEGSASLAKALGKTVPETREWLASLGLVAPPQGRTSIDQSDADVRDAIRQAQEIGSKYVVDYFAPFKDKDEILRYCEYFNRVGKMCADEGLTFLYHNHDHEFRKFDGEYGLEIMFANTDPKYVKQELDVGWVTFGGADPVAFLKKHADRCPVLHMKDFEKLHPGSPTGEGVRGEAVFMEVGNGVVNIAGVVEVAKEIGVDWLIIEQDRMNKLTPKESLAESFKNLKALLG